MCQYANDFKTYAVANWHIDKLINYFLCIYANKLGAGTGRMILSAFGILNKPEQPVS